MINNIFAKTSLNDGQQMPGYGFGVYKAHGDELLTALGTAFECGYRYIDTAAFYENEDTVGKAIKNSGIARDALYIVSKIWPTDFHSPIAALDKSLKLLGLDYLDAYLLHWPGLVEKSRLETYESLLREKEKGKIRTLGVSNFLATHLREINHYFSLWPPINQIEVHVHFQQKELCAFCADNKIQVVSWAPLGRGASPKLPELAALALECGKTPAQVILRWQIQKNLVPIPKSIHPEYIRQNAEVFDFSLTANQMEMLDNMNLPGVEGRTGKDPMKWPPM